MTTKKGEVKNNVPTEKAIDVSPKKQQCSTTSVKSAKERRWPAGSPAKDGSIAGHCMNND